MDIAFTNSRLRTVFNSEAKLCQKYGQRNARLIMRRMVVLKEAPTLADVSHQRPVRRHQLTADRQDQFAVYVEHPKRLIFELNHSPLPRAEDGGIELSQVTAITILGVEDYH